MAEALKANERDTPDYEYDIKRSRYFQRLNKTLSTVCSDKLLPPLIGLVAEYVLYRPVDWMFRLEEICWKSNDILRSMMKQRYVPYEWCGESVDFFHLHAKKKHGWRYGWVPEDGYHWWIDPDHNQLFVTASKEKALQPLEESNWFKDLKKRGAFRKTRFALPDPIGTELAECFLEIEKIYGSTAIFTRLSMHADDEDNVPLILFPDADCGATGVYTGAAIMFESVLL